MNPRFGFRARSLPRFARELDWVELDRHPDAVRVGVVAVPWIAQAGVTTHGEEWVMGESWRHRNVFVERVGFVFAELLHVARANDLCVHFEKLVPGMDSAIGFFRRVPEIQLDAVAAGRSGA